MILLLVVYYIIKFTFAISLKEESNEANNYNDTVTSDFILELVSSWMDVMYVNELSLLLLKRKKERKKKKRIKWKTF